MEIWKDIKDFENYYEISNMGQIRRKKGTSHLKEKNLKFSSDKDGYLRVNLKVKQKSNTKIVHRLLAIAFIENVDNKPQVNHINGIKSDYRIENLEWVTLSQNRQHAYDTGLQNANSRKGEKNNFSKLTNEQVLEIRKMYIPYKFTNKMIAKIYNVTEGCISGITSKRNWKQ